MPRPTRDPSPQPPPPFDPIARAEARARRDMMAAAVGRATGRPHDRADTLVTAQRALARQLGQPDGDPLDAGRLEIQGRYALARAEADLAAVTPPPTTPATPAPR